MPAYGVGTYGEGPYGIAVTLDDYLSKVTSEHAQQPNFIAVLSMYLQPFVDLQNLLLTFFLLFDIDFAVGDQLDIIGKWVGVSRYITIPIPSVFFSFDIAGLGFDEGTWYGPGDATTGLTTLPDDSYRTLLRARIAADHWDGTLPGAYAAWNIIFPPHPLLPLDGVYYTRLNNGPGNPIGSPLYLKVSVFVGSEEVAITSESPALVSGGSVYAQIHFPTYLGATKWRAYWSNYPGQENHYVEWTEAYVASLGRVVAFNSAGSLGSPSNGASVQIQDNQDMTVTVTYTGPTLDAVQKALFSGGYLGLKPAGVAVTYVIP